MIELAQHIEVLLLENDCVIVPGLGGFVAHYMPAKRMAEENLFLPPTRIIGFNPQLKMNDGVLVQSYMAVYGTNFSDATKLIDKTIKGLFAILHENGKVDLSNVGELRYSIYDTFDFIPYDNKIATPYLYGLDSFEMLELSEIKMPHIEKVIFQTSTIAKTEKRRFKIKYTYLSNAAAMIAVIALFFFSSPIENTEVMEANYAQLLPNELFERIEKQSLAITSIVVHEQTYNKKEKTFQVKPMQVSKNKRSVPVVAKEVKVADQSISTSVQPAQSEEMPFHIIVASVGTKKDAETIAAQLIMEGFSSAKAIIGDGKMRVSIQSCITEADAYRVLNKMRQNDAYQSAWILKK